MPRELADVLHYFIPEAESGQTPADTHRPALRRSSGRHERRGPAALPLVGLPIGEQDVVRAAFVWNLAVEISRLGARAAIVTPSTGEFPDFWPETGPSPIAAEIVLSDAQDLSGLYRDALDIAVDRADEASEGGLVLVRIPPLWLRDPGHGAQLLRWTLLFTSSDTRELLETYGLAKILSIANPGTRLGVTVHGARRVGEAKAAFDQLSSSTARHLGRALTSYGLLVDDLQVYRAIIAQHPIGLMYPQSPAARSLRDVAQLLLHDAEQMARA